MRRRRPLVLVLALLATVTACGDGDDSGEAPIVAGNSDSAAGAFCDAWNAAMASGDDAAFDEVLADAPAEIADDARIVREAANGEMSSEEEAAVSEILDWAELNCRQVLPGASARHVAPPVDATFDGLTFCGTTALPGAPPSDTAGMVLYGESVASDPYDGPMLGLFWNPADDGNTSAMATRSR